MTTQFAVIVTKPGHDTVRIGPIPWEHQADSMCALLNQQLHSTGAPEGTHSASGPYLPELPHLPLLPGDAYALAVLMDAELDGDPEALYPDLYSRFAAQVGDERGPALWRAACQAWDAMNAEPEEEQPSEMDQLRERVSQLEAAVRRFNATTGCYCPDAPSA
jgi:hypothetical protein